MIITITSTSEVLDLGGLPARVWNGTTPGGHPLRLYVSRIEADGPEAAAELDALVSAGELNAADPPPSLGGDLEATCVEFGRRLEDALARHEAAHPQSDARAGVVAGMIRRLKLRAGDIFEVLNILSRLDQAGAVRR